MEADIARKAALLEALGLLVHNAGGDIEERHMAADELLLEYIGDDDITVAFETVPKWYA